jgi:hypothetical protein
MVAGSTPACMADGCVYVSDSLFFMIVMVRKDAELDEGKNNPTVSHSTWWCDINITPQSATPPGGVTQT